MEAQASLEGATGLFVLQQKDLEAGQAVLNGSVARLRADPGEDGDQDINGITPDRRPSRHPGWRCRSGESAALTRRRRAGRRR